MAAQPGYNTRSKSLLNDVEYGTFKEALLEAITEILPRIIEEITPLILEKSKSVIEQNAPSLFLNSAPVENRNDRNIREECDKFVYDNQNTWNTKLHDRKDVMYKFLRCDKLILLYNNCLEEEPMYIPRKFRNDRVHIMNDNEKNIYDKLALQKLKTEMEILTNRREHFRNKLDGIDNELKQFIESKNIRELLKKEIESEWQENCEKQYTRLDEIWKKKIEGTMKGFEKDKSYLRRNNNEVQQLNSNDDREHFRNVERRGNFEESNYSNSNRYNRYGQQNRNNYNSHPKNYRRHHHRRRQKQHQRY